MTAENTPFVKPTPLERAEAVLHERHVIALGPAESTTCAQFAAALSDEDEMEAVVQLAVDTYFGTTLAPIVKLGITQEVVAVVRAYILGGESSQGAPRLSPGAVRRVLGEPEGES